MREIINTENEFGAGVVKSWASICDEQTLEQACKISRVPVVDKHVALMPDAHFGYGPPVGSAVLTRDAIMPYAVGVDIGCGMIAVELELERGRLRGYENGIIREIRENIPSGVGTNHPEPVEAAYKFIKDYGLPQGLDNPALSYRKDSTLLLEAEALREKLLSQFGTLGSGNHFVEVCELASPPQNGDDNVWLVIHSGSRGIGNILATAHVKRAKEMNKEFSVELEDMDFAYVARGTKAYNEYIADMLWAQKYAFFQRECMMSGLLDAVLEGGELPSLTVKTIINCHHNYAEELEPGLWLTRKGAIDASVGKYGVIPGSMGAATYIVKGKGCEQAFNTSPHGSGRLLARGTAKRTLKVEDFKKQMEGKAWLDRDAEKLLDEAPMAYKDIETVMEDSKELVTPVVKLSQFINYKGL